MYAFFLKSRRSNTVLKISSELAIINNKNKEIRTFLMRQYHILCPICSSIDLLLVNS